MSLEAIKSITVAEGEARQRKSDAQLFAKKKIAETQAAGEAALVKTRSMAKVEVSKLMAEAEGRAAEHAEDLRGNTFNKCAAMRARAETRLDSAASLIVRRVVES